MYLAAPPSGPPHPPRRPANPYPPSSASGNSSPTQWATLPPAFNLSGSPFTSSSLDARSSLVDAPSDANSFATSFEQEPIYLSRFGHDMGGEGRPISFGSEMMNGREESEEERVARLKKESESSTGHGTSGGRRDSRLFYGGGGFGSQDWDEVDLRG
jgi:hypothetical protein